MPYRGTVSAPTIANRKRVPPTKPQHPPFAVHYTPRKTPFRRNPVRDLRKMSEIVLGSIRVRKVGFWEIEISQLMCVTAYPSFWQPTKAHLRVTDYLSK